MSMVPSETYFDGDPDGERADKVVSGFIVSVMMFALATGFVAVAFFAFQQMRGGVSVSAASEVLSRVANGPAAAEEMAPAENSASNPELAPPPAEQAASAEIAASDTPATDATPVPTIKPVRTRPPTVTFDSSIFGDTEQSAVAAPAPADEAPPEQLAQTAPSAALPIEIPAPRTASESGEMVPADDAVPVETPQPAPPVRTTPDETVIAAAEAEPSTPTASEETEVVAPALPDPPVAAPPEETQAPSAVSPATEAAPVDALSGTHLVQVGSFRSEDEATADWRRIERRFPGLLAGKARHVAFADLGERGIFYRLRIGPFASGEDARAHCQSLKDGGQDCLAVRQ